MYHIKILTFHLPNPFGGKPIPHFRSEVYLKGQKYPVATTIVPWEHNAGTGMAAAHNDGEILAETLVMQQYFSNPI